MTWIRERERARTTFLFLSLLDINKYLSFYLRSKLDIEYNSLASKASQSAKQRFITNSVAVIAILDTYDGSPPILVANVPLRAAPLASIQFHFAVAFPLTCSLRPSFRPSVSDRCDRRTSIGTRSKRVRFPACLQNPTATIISFALADSGTLHVRKARL